MVKPAPAKIVSAGAQMQCNMARQKGVFRVKGRLGGVSFYQAGGSDLARESGGPTREQLLNDPAFARTRENMSEFGASALVAKALRQGLAGTGKSFRDRTYVARVVRIMKAINSRGTGTRGQRAFSIAANSDLLVGFELNGSNVLAGVFNAPYTLAANVARNQATLTVPDFNTSAYVSAPPGATHFRLVCAAASLSNYSYNSITGQYEPANAVQNSLGTVMSSAQIPIGAMVGAATVLNPQLPGAPTLVATVALVVCIGIEFYQQLNGQFYLLGSGNAMRLAQVF
jgi:hypothetical protein